MKIKPGTVYCHELFTIFKLLSEIGTTLVNARLSIVVVGDLLGECLFERDSFDVQHSLQTTCP